MTNIKNMRKHRENIQKHSGGGVRIFVIALLVVTLFWLLFLCSSLSPAAAQSPTATPWPGPAATATAAAQNMTAAQYQQAQAAQMRAAAEAQRAQAAQLQQQADAALVNANASYSAAAQDASNARAALAAQQAGIAGEAIGRAEANISDGKAQLDRLGAVVNQLREMTNLQAGQLISMTLALQQAQADKQTTLNAYNAAITTQETNDRNSTALRIFGAIVVLVVIAITYVIIREVIRRRAIRSDDGGAAGDAEIIDQE